MAYYICGYNCRKDCIKSCLQISTSVCKQELTETARKGNKQLYQTTLWQVSLMCDCICVPGSPLVICVVSVTCALDSYGEADK